MFEIEKKPFWERKGKLGREAYRSAAKSPPFPESFSVVRGVAIVGYFLLRIFGAGGVGGPVGLGQGRASVSVSIALLSVVRRMSRVLFGPRDLPPAVCERIFFLLPFFPYPRGVLSV